MVDSANIMGKRQGHATQKRSGDPAAKKIFNSLGQRVFIGTDKSLFIDINLNHPASGIYHISVLTQSYMLSRSFIIK